ALRVPVVEPSADRTDETIGAVVEDAEARDENVPFDVEIHAQRAAEGLVADRAFRNHVGDTAVGFGRRIERPVDEGARGEEAIRRAELSRGRKASGAEAGADECDRAFAVVLAQTIDRTRGRVAGELGEPVAFRADRAAESGGEDDRSVERAKAVSAHELTGIFGRELDRDELRAGASIPKSRDEPPRRHAFLGHDSVRAAVEEADARDRDLASHVEVEAEHAA